MDDEECQVGMEYWSNVRPINLNVVFQVIASHVASCNMSDGSFS